MSIRNRLSALEQRSAGEDEPLVIIVEGGFSSPEPRMAVAGGHRWPQLPKESESAFALRASSLAKTAGEQFVVVGGSNPHWLHPPGQSVAGAPSD